MNSELNQTLVAMSITLASISTRLDRIEERLDSAHQHLDELILETRRPWNSKWAA
ncbi:hypothetical protein [Kocuria kalidii]|uniref:hypothetical protein n=1 Tax=Kocuria kalidii TaxID=3376283 RepID=UPI0037951519